MQRRTQKLWQGQIDIREVDMIIITDRLIDDNLELIISPLYRDSVGTEELRGII